MLLIAINPQGDLEAVGIQRMNEIRSCFFSAFGYGFSRIQHKKQNEELVEFRGSGGKIAI
jgi:hypothetical protein